MVGIEDLNKNQDQSIDLNELQDAMKPSWFLSNEKNMRDLKIQIDNPENPETIIKLKESLQNSLNLAIDDIVKKETFSDNEIQILNLWNILLWNDRLDKKNEVVIKMNNVVNNISARVNVDIGKNSKSNGNYYTVNDVKTIQLQANICFGEDIIINGLRWDLKDIFYLSTNTANERKTNIYIYRQELITRQEVIDIRPKDFEKILNIPNLWDMLGILWDIQTQNKVFGDFLNFFLGDIRVSWMFFENNIGNENLNMVLMYMIEKEKYANTSIDEYFKNVDDNELLEMKEKAIKDWYTTMGQFYESLIKTTKNEIIKVNKNNIENNAKLYEQIEINKQYNELINIQNEINRFETEKEKLEKEYWWNEGTKWRQIYNKWYNEISNKYREIAEKIPSKKCELYNKMLEVWKKSKNEWLILDAYLKIAKDYDNEQNIKKLFPWLNYQDFLAKTKDIKKTIGLELKKNDPINDIRLQYDTPWDMKIEKITSVDDYEKYFPIEYSQNNMYNMSSDNLWSHQSVSIPDNLYRIYYPGNKTPVYVKNNNDTNIPPQKPSKKIVILPNEKENIGIFSWNTSLNGTNNIIFWYVSKDNSWNLVIENINWTIYKTITKAELEKSQKTLEIANMSIYDADMEKTIDIIQTANTSLQKMTTIFDNFQHTTISDTELRNIRQNASSFLSYDLPRLEWMVPKFKESRDFLIKLRNETRSGWLTNTFEGNIDQMINTLGDMIDKFDSSKNWWTKSDIRSFLWEISTIYSNDTRQKKVIWWLKNNWIQTLITIAAAVAAILLAMPSWWTSVWWFLAYLATNSLYVAAVSTVWGMIGSRVGQYSNELFQNAINSTIIDWRKFDYTNPTDVELLFQKEIDPKLFFGNILKEFAIGTATQRGFIKAWQFIGNMLPKLAKYTPKEAFYRWLEKLKNTFTKIWSLPGDEAAVAASTFRSRFAKEFWDEIVDESMETTGDQIPWPIWKLISLLNCITPSKLPPKFYTTHQIGWWISTKNGEVVTTELTYKSDDIQSMINGFKSQELILDPSIDQSTIKAGDVIIMKVKWTNETVKFIPSIAPIEIRNMTDFQMFWFEIDHTSSDNKLLIPADMDANKLQTFKAKVAISWIGLIVENTDWSFNITNNEKTINFVKNTNPVVIETNPETMNKNIFEESVSLEKDLISMEKDLNIPVEEISDNNVSFTDKASKFNILLDRIGTYTESIKKLTSQKNILTEKISVLINNNLQKTKDILLVRPNHIIKEINHIKGEIVGYTGSLKNSSWFLLKSALTIWLIRESIHPLVEVWHKIENVLNILHWTYDHVISEGLSVAIDSVNMGLLNLESGLIRIDTNIKTKRIVESFMAKIEWLALNTQSPNEYISSLYDIIIENPEFGYDTQDIANIKNIINNIDITKPITENTHNEIIDYLLKNIQPKIIEKSSKIDNSVGETEIGVPLENTESNKKEEIHSELVKNTYNKIIQEITMDIKEWNNVEKNTYILASMENLSKTSRTAQWILDASASDNKQFKFENITPEEAWVIALENFQKLSEYIYINKDMQFLSVEELQWFVENIAKKTNEWILKPEYFMRDENPKLDEKTGKPKYAYTDKDGLDTAFNQFIVEFYDKLNNPATNPIELASRVEYRVNLKDHFFADGCGKTSILLSNFVLMRYGEALPQIRDGKERFKFSWQTQRDVSRPEYNPDLETWTEYYKTLFTMNKINNCKNIQEINTFISDYNKNNTSAIGKELIIWNKKIIKEWWGRSVDYYFITAEGKLETKRIENYVMDKVKEAATPDKIDQFIKEYNKNSPAKSQEAILGIYEGYCFVRGSENWEISRIKLNKNDVAPSVDFTKMSWDEILVYSIENADNLIGKYSESLKSKNEEFVVDVDWFRQFIGANEKVIAEKTHGWASFLADYYFDKIIENNKGIEGKNNTIRFVGGGAWSGKSLTSSEEFWFHGNFNGVRDGTMKTYNNAKFKIDKAIDAWFDVKIDFVFREMNAARNNGVLKRAVEQNLKMRIGDIQDVLDGKYNNELSHIDYVWRTLPIHVFYTAHVWSRETFRLLHQNWYADKIRFFNGSNVIDGIGNFQNLCNNDKFNFELWRQTATSLYEKWFISEAQYNDLIPQK